MSPNLTAALLDERAKKLTAVDVPGADLTIHVRELSYREGRDFRQALLNLPELTEDSSAEDRERVNIAQEDFMASLASAVIADPATFKPVFTAECPIDSLPLPIYKATLVAAVIATGIMGKAVIVPPDSTVPVSEAAVASPLAPEETSAPAPEHGPVELPATTPSGPSTATLEVPATATESSTVSPPVSASGT